MKFFLYSCVLFAVVFLSCKKGRYYDITYTVDVIPTVDSLPISVQINGSVTDRKHWSIESSRKIDTYTTLIAKGLSNIKRIDSKIEGWKSPPSTGYCESQNCTIEVRYNLYDK